MSRTIKVLLTVLIPLLFCCSGAFADKIAIKNFVLKDNPFGTGELAVVAVDTAGIPQKDVNGKFLFTINGFQETLKFDNGTAFYHRPLSKSSFIFVKHENDTGTHSTLFYVYKTDSKLIPIHISWVVLIVIPLMLMLLGYLFKKFIIIAAVLLVVFFVFNHSNGLDIHTFFETVINGLKHMF